MSLINDALKKAARLRAEEQAGMPPPMPGGSHGRISRQREPIRTQTVVLVAGAAVALVVVSAVITGILVTAKPEPKAAVTAKAAPEALPTPAPQKVVVQVPSISVPVAAPPTPAPTSPAKAAEAPPRVVRAAEPPAAAPPSASSPQVRNELVQGIVDRLHVSGARAAGADSKALVDGHVYRVNDIVDKTVGLKLVKVEPDRLTLVDAAGDTYQKSY